LLEKFCGLNVLKTAEGKTIWPQEEWFRNLSCRSTLEKVEM